MSSRSKHSDHWPEPKKGGTPKKIGSDKGYGPGGPQTPGAKAKLRKAKKAAKKPAKNED